MKRNTLAICCFGALVATVAFAQADNPATGTEAKPKLDRKLPEAKSGATSFTLDRVVAVVNTEVITLQELQSRIGVVAQQLRRQGTDLPTKSVLARQVLERMINDLIQLQLARETGLRIDEAQVDKALERIAGDNRLGLAEFRTALQADGVDFNKFREDIRTEMTLARLREREVDSKIVVSESELEGELEVESKRPAQDVEYLLSHIVVQIPEQANAEQIEQQRKKADLALASLRSGTDFAQVAASYSDAQDALQGGNLGWRAATRLPKLYVDAAVGLKNGQISGLIKSANGFHIVKLVDLRGGGQAQIINQTKARHILVKINEIVTEADAKTRILQAKERLDKGAPFADVARTQSDDPSAPNGGELGWISPGDTVPEFEQVLESLPLGKVSDPVRTPFGWHLIEVTERRTQDVTVERARLAARQGLRARKADEAYLDWLRQLRDRAYVEYRGEER